MTAKTTTTAAQDAISATVETATATLADGAVRAQAFNDQFVAVVKQAGLLGVDNYEKSLSTIIDFQKKIAGASGLDWLGSLVEAQAGLVVGLSTTATSAAREVLK